MNRLGISLGVAALAAFHLLAAFGPGNAAERVGAPAPEVKADAKAQPKHDYAQLMQKHVDYFGTDDPKTKLDEVLLELAKDYDCSFELDERAFEAEGIKDVQNAPMVTDGRPIPKMTDVRFDRLLRKILSRIPNVEAAFIVHDDVIEITTRQAVLVRVYGNNPRRTLPLVYAAFDKQPLEDALKELAKQTEYNILIDPRPAEKIKTGVTANLKNVPLDSAVQLLADMADLKAVLQDNVLYVTTKDNAKAIEAENHKRHENEPPPPDERRGPPM
jgi:hypothetical protein